MKRSLAKALATPGNTQSWDEHLPFIQLAYNCSTQASLGFSPYHILYAVPPTLPSSVVPKLQAPLVIDSDSATQRAHVVKSIVQRAADLKRMMPVAHENLLIAQHRDTLRYRRLRDGTYMPEPHDFRVGDYVYLQRPKLHSLLIVARPAILRVVAVKRTGVLILMGRDGLTRKAHVSQVAPCHLTNIDPVVDKSLQGEEASALCEVCQEPDPDGFMFCDKCNTGWHMHCLVPPLLTMPEGSWYCPRCSAVPAALVCDGTSRSMPPTWDLTDATQVDVALQMLMPGVRAPHRLTRLSDIVSQCVYAPHTLRMVRTDPVEVDWLLRRVRLPPSAVVVDPFSGTGTIQRVLAGHGVAVFSNDLNPLQGAAVSEDALQPSFYENHPAEFYVTSPYFAVLDIALPLMLRFATVAVMVHVPGHYLFDPTEPRQRFFQSLVGRMAVLAGLPKGPLGRRCAWLVIAVSSTVLRDLFDHDGSLPLVYGLRV